VRPRSSDDRMHVPTSLLSGLIRRPKRVSTSLATRSEQLVLSFYLFALRAAKLSWYTLKPRVAKPMAAKNNAIFC
jgi:hypothetical protein